MRLEFKHGIQSGTYCLVFEPRLHLSLKFVFGPHIRGRVRYVGVGGPFFEL